MSADEATGEVNLQAIICFKTAGVAMLRRKTAFPKVKAFEVAVGTRLSLGKLPVGFQE